jgi:hypothetical protein
MTDTMIQRLARTMLLADAEGVKLWKTENGVQGYAWDFEAAQEMVKRVLTAMREPTDVMVSKAGLTINDTPMDALAVLTFRAMIDAALAEGA